MSSDTNPAQASAVRQRSRGSRAGACPFCRRELPLTFHHLIPKKLHRRTRFRKRYTREQLNRGIEVCRQCHDGIHDRYDEMTLYRAFSEPGRLSADPELARYFDWVSRQKVR
jgi:5-methylcytosine-specific restriction endonuclease McrA